VKRNNGGKAGTKLLLVLLSIFFLMMLLVPAASAQQLGDVNFDGVVDIRDVVLIQRHILGYQPPLSAAQLAVADVNGDGMVNVVDVNLIMQYIQGYINSFPVQQLYAPVLISPIEAASVSGSMVSFQWGAVSGATRFQLEITKVSDGTTFRMVDLGNVTSTTQYAFADDGTQYRWRVRAGNSTQWGAWSVYRTFTNGAALPAPTLGVPAENAVLDNTSVSFQWSSVTGATRYQLEVIRVSDGYIFKNPELGNLVNTTVSGFPNDGTQYRWRVRAGTASQWGLWSVYRTFTNGAALPAPTLGYPANDASLDTTSINFQWSAVTGANRYQFEVVRVSDSFIFKNIELGNLTTVSQSGFPNDGTEYRWRVRAGNATSWGSWSTYRYFTSGVTVPAPTLTSPENNAVISGTSVLFRWNEVSGATKYQLEVVQGVQGLPFKDVTLGKITMSEQFGFLRDGTEYRWRVRAGNATGWGAWSGYFTFNSGQLPATPVLISPISILTPVAGRQVSFSWQAVMGANNYEIEIVNERTGALLTKALLGNVTSSVQRGFDDDGTTYKWRVRAAGSEGWGAWSDYAYFVNGDTPGAPVLSEPEHNASISRSWINFEWKPAVGADRYQLKISKDGTVYRTVDVSNRTTSLQQDFPVDGGIYTWTVRSGNANGWGTIWATERSFTVGSPFARPTLLLPADYSTQTEDEITFSWQSVDGATIYELQVAEFATGTLFESSTTTSTSQAVYGFTPANQIQYKWRVRAGESLTGGNRWGDWSGYRHFINEDPANPALSAPALTSPAEGAVATGTAVYFSWTSVTDANKYNLQVLYANGSGNVFIENNNVTAPPHEQAGFPDDVTPFYWRVRSSNASGWGPWSFYRQFTNGFWWVMPF
jgi:hypothetical protein